MSKTFGANIYNQLPTYTNAHSLRSTSERSGAHVYNLSLEWRHNERDGVSNHQSQDCLLNRLFRRRSKKPPKLRVIGLCVGNSPVTDEFPAQKASNAENDPIWWRHHVTDDIDEIESAGCVTTYSHSTFYEGQNNSTLPVLEFTVLIMACDWHQRTFQGLLS